MTTLPALDLPENDAATAWLHRRTQASLSQVRELVTGIKTAPPARASVLMDRWNVVEGQMANIASIASTFAELHPVPAAREQGEDALQQVERLRTELDLDHALFTVFAEAESAGLEEPAARLHTKVLQDFRRAGVDQDEGRRHRLAEIAERMVVLGQEFSKNIREDTRAIRVRPDQLAGMPQDWIDARPAGRDGLVEVSTDYPDFVPFSTFCTDAAARRELRIEFLNQAWPANDAILQELFALRREYAHLVGYANWADYTAEVRMIGSGPAIGEFIETVTAAAAASARRDREVVLARLRQDRPQETTIDAADVAYYTELVRSEQFDVDAQQVRTFFDFGRVCAGLLAVTGRLFDLEYRPAPQATV
ncbi:MAG TPA: M3 family metallopeptidase, partial [Beutenbergiaceae bacterium]|nr:M3 family metallopeptidase [Beutenbergiaceae bacterium]